MREKITAKNRLNPPPSSIPRKPGPPGSIHAELTPAQAAEAKARTGMISDALRRMNAPAQNIRIPPAAREMWGRITSHPESIIDSPCTPDLHGPGIHCRASFEYKV